MTIFEVTEAMGRVSEAFAGLRFLFSPSYRGKTLKRWANSSKIQIFLECIGAIIGIAFVLLVFYALASLGWANEPI